ncbi:MAG: Methyltransferase type 11 [Thermotoga sp. 50_1627]|nr:MAG: Methyltransferase type 11 [Thermotoga sp. 50_64]KUK24907.1 MAG: Methyltransferase type 11 [Thermotoga sp. 50_1627]MBC7116234.1 class I SAM-dependent methyltransferase [Pseudothermotoga sp.]HBT38741.1 methyltransferase type 11 [Pseudothermotoga sp.]HCO98254.1 methyltransferase type 11 [Pseudothermotoga sp.]
MGGYYSLRDQTLRLTPEVNGQRVIVINTGAEDVFTRILLDRAVFITTDEEFLKLADPRSIRLVMNPTKLSFAPESFDAAVLFFAFFYLPKHEAIIENINRVLKKWGKLYIWDAVIPKKMAHKSFFVVPLLIDTNQELIRTVHVTKWRREQPVGLVKKIARERGFKLTKEELYDQIFHLEMVKIAPIKQQKS